MRLCFGPWCVAWPGRKKTAAIAETTTAAAAAAADVDEQDAEEDDATMTRAMPNADDDGSSADMAASVDAQDAKTLLEAKDVRIRNLESLLRDRDNEIQELRSHLDMFQSVFPFSNPVSPTAATLSSLHHAVSVSFRRPSPPSGQNLVAKSLTSLLDGIARPRKQRAQGISAEPQSLSTIQELSQKKFPTYPKNDRISFVDSDERNST